MKNGFYLKLKALSVLKISYFYFLSIGHLMTSSRGHFCYIRIANFSLSVEKFSNEVETFHKWSLQEKKHFD